MTGTLRTDERQHRTWLGKMGVNRLVDTWTGAVSYPLRTPFTKFRAARHEPIAEPATKAATVVKTR